MQVQANKRRLLCAGGGLTVLAVTAGCTTTGGASGDPDARRQAIDSAVDNALSRLHREVAGSQELVNAARGVLVFPSVVSAGFMVGGSHGQGALRKGGKTAGYFRMTEASVGLLAGAQSQAVFILFMTEDALRRFEASRGWTAGVDGSISIVTVGADARVTTQTVRQEIVGFVLTNAGLMGSVSLNGNRITRIDL
jgi:lipid-binding SYLF domain-containing protein